MSMNSEQSLYHLIKYTARVFRARMDRSFAEAGYDVTSEQWRILKCLWYQDGQRQQDLADHVNKDKTSITRIIDSMEKRNLVVRVPDKFDRRQKLVYLTNKGKEMREELMRLAEEISLIAQQGIDPKDLETFKRVLSDILKNITQS